MTKSVWSGKIIDRRCGAQLWKDVLALHICILFLHMASLNSQQVAFVLNCISKSMLNSLASLRDLFLYCSGSHSKKAGFHNQMVGYNDCFTQTLSYAIFNESTLLTYMEY